MSTIRVSKSKNFSVINNTVLNDVRLTWKAKGIAAYLLSKPDDWKIIRENLINQSDDGETAVRSALQELEECGYLVRTRRQNEFGQIEWESVLSETPSHRNPKKKEPDKRKPPMRKPQVEKPQVVLPMVENQGLLSTDVLSTDLLNTETTKAGARVDHSLVAQSATSTPPAAVPAPALTQSEIDGFSEATNVKANAPSPYSAPPPSRIVSEDPIPSGPKVIPKSRCVVTCRNFDPRKLVDGYIPAGKGETPTEVYLESFKLVPTKPQMEALNREITDIPKWRDVCSRVVLRSLNGNSYSFDNMLDIYRSGFREQRGNDDGNGGKNFGRNNGQNNQSAFAQQSSPKRFDPYDRSTWDREMLATFDPISLAEIEREERGLSNM